ncbi:MAG: hypothetical protein A3I72_14145 [Candidatus Tectomicrobia bacterium RIFCSPLOWO2_02_FULL_70_19]|nr:MAG: hypothetical protein A3I72_14145 [Candidatus Tectomicrobia bacterium RIFCSPLOWO2_02_FULL_70_19]
MRKLFVAWAALLWLAAPASAAPKDGTLVIAFKQENPTHDPHTESSQISNALNRWVIQTLMHRTPQGKLVPLIVKKHKWVNNKTLELELREGIKFSNGEELDASAVKYSLERIHDPKIKSRQKERFRVIGKKNAVEVLGKHKVRINLAFPDAGFLNRLGNVGGIVPPKYYSSKDPIYLTSHPIGSAPYLLKKWVRDDRAEYEANPVFWDPQYPKVKRVISKIIPEDGARVAALIKGEVDVIFEVPASMWDKVNASGKAKVVAKPGIRIFRIGFYNKWGGIFADKKVRMAVAHAIDRKTLQNTVVKGVAVDATQVLHPLTEGFLKPGEFPYPYAYDPAKSRKLLAEAGHPNGIEVDLVAQVGSYLKDKDSIEVLAGMLQKAGIKVKMTQLNNRGYRNRFRKHRKEAGPDFKPFLYFHSFGGGGGDSDLQLAAVAGCIGAWSGWCDKDFDKMLNAASALTDEEEREKAFENLTRKLTNDVAFIPLYRLNATFGLSNRVDWDPRVDERPMAWEIGLK